MSTLALEEDPMAVDLVLTGETLTVVLADGRWESRNCGLATAAIGMDSSADRLTRSSCHSGFRHCGNVER